MAPTPPSTHLRLVARAFLPVDDDLTVPSAHHGTSSVAVAAAEFATDALTPADAADPAEPPADLPIALEPEPPGRDLSQHLADALDALGWSIPSRWTTYSSHAFEVDRRPVRLDVEVALVSQDAALWRLTVKPRTRFFARNTMNPAELAVHTALRHDLDAVLAQDPRTRGAAGPWRSAEDDAAVADDVL